MKDPEGYGRIIRDPKANSCGSSKKKRLLPGTAYRRNKHPLCLIRNSFFSPFRADPKKNRQKEYYLTDVVQLARENGLPVAVSVTLNLRGLRNQRSF
jgi:bifunctional N-acetylglucosamine-1-phosphate-uridyltransferase/glucosamine-1-phosphate-acetyltransferase GlmU-like protein